MQHWSLHWGKGMFAPYPRVGANHPYGTAQYLHLLFSRYRSEPVAPAQIRAAWPGDGLNGLNYCIQTLHPLPGLPTCRTALPSPSPTCSAPSSFPIPQKGPVLVELSQCRGDLPAPVFSTIIPTQVGVGVIVPGNGGKKRRNKRELSVANLNLIT